MTQASESASEPVGARIMRGGYFALLGSVVMVLGNFTTSVILARMLGSERLGTFEIFMAILGVLLPLIGLSIPVAVTRFISQLRDKEPERLSAILATALRILTFVGLVGTVVMYAIAPLVGELYQESRLVPMLYVAAVVTLANMLSFLSHGILQGLEEFQTASIVAALAVLTNTVFLLLVVPDFGLLGAAVATAAAVLANATFGTFSASRALRRHGVTWNWSPSRTSARLLLSFAGPLYAASIFAKLAFLVQISLVATQIGFFEVGYLRVAAFFFNSVLFLPRTLLAPLLPILTNVVATRSAARTREILSQLVRLFLLLIVPLAGTLIFSLPFALELFYGQEFLPAHTLAVTYTAAALVVVPGDLLGDQYLLATGRTKAALAIGIFASATSLLAVVGLYTIIGVLAIPTGTLIVEFAAFAILTIWLRRRQEVTVSKFLPVLAYGIAVVVLASALSRLLTPWVGLASGIILFVVLASSTFFVLMNQSERDIITKTIRRGTAGARELF